MLCTWRFPMRLVCLVCLAYLMYLSYLDLQQGKVLLGSQNMPFRSTDWQISLPRARKGPGGYLGRGFVPCCQDVMGNHTTWETLCLQLSKTNHPYTTEIPLVWCSWQNYSLQNTVRTYFTLTHLIPDDAISNLFSSFSGDRPPNPGT